MVWVTNDECHEFRLIDLTGPRVPAEILRPRESWADKSAYDATATKQAGLFNKNFETYAVGASA